MSMKRRVSNVVQKSGLRRIIKLVLGLVAFYFFSTILLKEFNNSEFAEPVQSVVREKNLNPAAFFYSDDLHIDTLGVENSEDYLIK